MDPSNGGFALPEPALEPAFAARAAGLRYVTDAKPGIRRLRQDDGFTYVDPSGQPVQDERELERIKALGIPPAWTDVWIATSPRAHIQATGRDARGRKQYRYHARWREVRDQAKYDHVLAFAGALPQIRQQVEDDLRLPGLPRRKVLAAVVRLLESTLIRVGNEEYVRQNASFGLTTLRNRHVDITGATIRFHFRGKSGKAHQITLHDRRLARIVQRCHDLPGHELFEYVDEDGVTHTVESEDVNEYLREITQQDLTAKDFRTWGGTILAAGALASLGPPASDADAKRKIAEAIKEASSGLGNTPAICRKCYVHPGVLDAYLNGSLATRFPPSPTSPQEQPVAGLHPEEAAIVELLAASA